MAKINPVTDSAVVKGEMYNPERGVLRLVYKNGGHYEHGNITPEKYAAFQQAESKGKWLKENLAGKNAANHPFQKVPALEEETPQ